MESFIVDTLANAGMGGLFIWYLMSREGKDRDERKLRAKADLRLALAIDRLVRTITGAPLSVPEGSDEEV